VILDSKKKDGDGFHGVYMYKPNTYEFDIITGRIHDPRISIQDAARKLIDKHNIKYIFLTLGAEGCMVLGSDLTESIHCPSRCTQVVEVSGAGDSVLAALAIGEAHAMKTRDIANLAMDFAAIAISHSPSDLKSMTSAYRELGLP